MSKEFNKLQRVRLRDEEKMSDKGFKQMSASDKTAYGELVSWRNYFEDENKKTNALKQEIVKLRKDVRLLKQEIEPLRKQKSEYDFFFDQERFLKDALDAESKESSTLLGENITLKERNKDLDMDLKDGKSHKKSCLEKIDHLKETLDTVQAEHSNSLAENSKLSAAKVALEKDYSGKVKDLNVRISELGENKSLHLEKIKYLEIQLNSLKKTLCDSQRRESNLLYRD